MFPDITKRQRGTGVVSAELLEDLEHGRDLTEAAISDRTRAAYEYEFGRFAQWAGRHKLASLPTTPAIAATYRAHLSKRGASTATLAIVRAAIKHHHVTLPTRAKGRNLDLATPEIKRLFQGARRKAREAGRKTNKAAPFLIGDFEVLAGQMKADDLEDLRDLALIGLGIVRALRGPSELLTLDLGEAKSEGARGALVLKREGAAITLSVSKTKQTGDGEELPIEEGPALKAVRAWVQAAGIKPGTPLWRAVRKGHVQPDRMHQRTLHNIIQRRAAVVAAVDSIKEQVAGQLKARVGTSGSRRAERPVEPTRSQNITVSWRRSALVGATFDAGVGGEGGLTAEAACPASLPPQSPQNLAAGGFAAPQLGQGADNAAKATWPEGQLWVLLPGRGCRGTKPMRSISSAAWKVGMARHR